MHHDILYQLKINVSKIENLSGALKTRAFVLQVRLSPLRRLCIGL